MLALHQACRPDVWSYGGPIRLLFIEERRDRFEHLDSLTRRRCPPASQPRNLQLKVVEGSCERILIPALAGLQAEGAPIFANFDGWGVDTPMSLIRHVGRYPSAEVLVTFETQWFIRFANKSEVAAGDLVFGDANWRPLAGDGSPSEKKSRLVKYYRAKLAEARFPYSLVFEMIDEGGHELLLIFGTGSIRGMEKMKDAMWSVDRAYGQRFRDPRDVNQLSFEVSMEPDLTLLKVQLLETLISGQTSLSALKDFAVRETVFKGTHVPVAIDELESARKVDCTHARKHEDFLVRLAPASLFD